MSDPGRRVLFVGELVSIAIGIQPNSRKPLRRGTSATSWYERGVAVEAADPAAAKAAYLRALAALPAFADAHNNLGRIYHDAAPAPGVLALAESHYRLAICADATVALYWFNLGVALEDQGRHAEALAAYDTAVGLDAGFADAHFNLARLHEALGRARGDELELQRAVRHLLRYRNLTRGAAIR